MPVSQSEITRRVESMADALRASGLRLTHQRLQVVREIARTDEHPDAETIYRRVRRRVPTISLDTVYRSLGALADLGLISRFTGVGGPARYDPNLVQHHHFVCTRCGLVRDIAGDLVEVSQPPPQLPVAGTIESVEVNFKGVCAQCRPTAYENTVAERKESHR